MQSEIFLLNLSQIKSSEAWFKNFIPGLTEFLTYTDSSPYFFPVCFSLERIK